MYGRLTGANKGMGDRRLGSLRDVRLEILKPMWDWGSIVTYHHKTLAWLSLNGVHPTDL